MLITLAITPFRKLLSLPALIRYRRMLGLFAFFYGCLHLTTYLWLYQSFDFHAIWADVVKRRFITVGFIGFVLMIPLAITSTKGWIRRLGGKNWTWLHRLIYFSAIAGVIHYAWLVKSDETKPLQYAVILGILFLYRIVASIIGSKKPPAMRAARPRAGDAGIRVDRISVVCSDRASLKDFRFSRCAPFPIGRLFPLVFSRYCWNAQASFAFGGNHSC